jgi:hypothetical protein
MIAIYYLPLHGLDAPANAFYPSQYNDLEYEEYNFRPQGLNGETLPFLLREYDSWLYIIICISSAMCA